MGRPVTLYAGMIVNERLIVGNLIEALDEALARA